MLLDLQSRMTSAIREAVAAPVIATRTLPGLRPPERLAIHARNYRVGLTAALGEIYPAMKRLTGAGFFDYAAAQFLSSHPPTDPVVAAYGAAFPDFLSNFQPAAALPFLADVARFEWSMHLLADRLPPPALDPGVLAGAGDLTCNWSPSAELFASAWPTDLLLEADDLSALDLKKPSYLLLWTNGEAVSWRRQSKAGFAFLQTLKRRGLLSTAIDTARSHDTCFNAAEALRNALAAGCFAALAPTKDHLP